MGGGRRDPGSAAESPAAGARRHSARSIKECLLIQLQRMNTKQPDVKMAIRLLEEHFTDLHNRNMDRSSSTCILMKMS
jgi:DNA-directed RNA polymerase specialized sigma54-like protein